MKIFKKKLNVFKMLFAIFICQLAGILGSIATYPNIPTWYASLQKPWFTPPGWLFGPAWITLYTLMGIALYLILENGWDKKETKMALYVFSLQLILNSLWSFLFFGLQNPFLAFIEIIILWITIAATLVLFYRINRTAGIILIPYICWVTFASLLNYYVWLLNP